MHHPFMEAAATQLADQGIATFRYQFPYMEQSRKPPNPRPVLIETIRSAVTAATQAADGLPVLAGGKSMGGRMTSLAAAEEPLPRPGTRLFRLSAACVRKTICRTGRASDPSHGSDALFTRHPRYARRLKPATAAHQSTWQAGDAPYC